MYSHLKTFATLFQRDYVWCHNDTERSFIMAKCATLFQKDDLLWRNVQHCSRKIIYYGEMRNIVSEKWFMMAHCDSLTQRKDWLWRNVRHFSDRWFFMTKGVPLFQRDSLLWRSWKHCSRELIYYGADCNIVHESWFVMAQCATLFQRDYLWYGTLHCETLIQRNDWLWRNVRHFFRQMLFLWRKV